MFDLPLGEVLCVLVRGIYRRCRPGASPKDEENEWMTFYKYRYVVKLLEPLPKEFRDKSGDTSLKGKLKGKFYKWRPDFKYSTRVICIYAVSFIGIYMILFLDCWFAMQLLWLRDSIVEGYVATVDTVREWLMIGVVSIFVAAGVAGIHSIILVANMLSWYRGHLLRLQRGEKNFLPKEVFGKKTFCYHGCDAEIRRLPSGLFVLGCGNHHYNCDRNRFCDWATTHYAHGAWKL